MRIVPDTRDPRKYVQIAENLEAQIITSILEPGEIVTATELAAEFSVSKATARHAIKILEEKGFIVGYGTIGFVVTRKCPVCGQQRKENSFETR